MHISEGKGGKDSDGPFWTLTNTEIDKNAYIGVPNQQMVE
jgi:hypothetical protein